MGRRRSYEGGRGEGPGMGMTSPLVPVVVTEEERERRRSRFRSLARNRPRLETREKDLDERLRPYSRSPLPDITYDSRRYYGTQSTVTEYSRYSNHASQSEQRHPISAMPRATCPVCRNLSRFQYIEQYAEPIFVEALEVSIAMLNESTDRGCAICSLVIRGISEFSKSLPLDVQSLFKPRAVDKVKISCSEWGSLSVHLPLRNSTLGFDLDFFTTRGISRLISCYVFVY